jgi:hypothetical protein
MLDNNRPGQRNDRNAAWDMDSDRQGNENLRLRARWVLIAIVVIYAMLTLGAVGVLLTGNSKYFTPGPNCGDNICDSNAENPFSCPQDCGRISR